MNNANRLEWVYNQNNVHTYTHPTEKQHAKKKRVWFFSLFDIIIVCSLTKTMNECIFYFWTQLNPKTDNCTWCFKNLHLRSLCQFVNHFHCVDVNKLAIHNIVSGPNDTCSVINDGYYDTNGSLFWFYFI